MTPHKTPPQLFNAHGIGVRVRLSAERIRQKFRAGEIPVAATLNDGMPLADESAVQKLEQELAERRASGRLHSEMALPARFAHLDELLDYLVELTVCELDAAAEMKTPPEDQSGGVSACVNQQNDRNPNRTRPHSAKDYTRR